MLPASSITNIRFSLFNDNCNNHPTTTMHSIFGIIKILNNCNSATELLQCHEKLKLYQELDDLFYKVYDQKMNFYLIHNIL